MMTTKLIDVIIILGKGVQADGSPPLRVQHEIDYALQLCQQQPIQAVLFSGRYSGLVKQHPAVTEAAGMIAYAQARVSDNTALLLTEEQSEDTIGNLVFSKVIIDQHHWTRILVMSTADHLQRVQYICKRVFGSDYIITYHGQQQTCTARQWLHVRRYELLTSLYAHWVLRRTWPNDNPRMIEWIQHHHFMYNGYRIKVWLQGWLKRPVHR